MPDILTSLNDRVAHHNPENGFAVLKVQVQERRIRVRHNWEEQREVSKIMLFLTEHLITSGRAVRFYRTYAHEFIAKIKETPYQLAENIRGICFTTADGLAVTLGIDREVPIGPELPFDTRSGKWPGRGTVDTRSPAWWSHHDALIEVGPADRGSGLTGGRGRRHRTVNRGGR